MVKRMVLGPVVAVLMVVIAVGGAPRPAVQEEPELREFAEARVVIAQRAIAEIKDSLIAPPAADGEAVTVPDFQRYTDWSQRWMEARLDLETTKEARMAVIRAHIARLEAWAKPMKEMVAARGSRVSPRDVDLLDYHVLEAKGELIKEKNAK